MKLSKVSIFLRIICKKTKSIDLFLIVVILIKSSNLKVSIHIKQVKNSPKRCGMHGNFEQTFELKNIP